MNGLAYQCDMCNEIKVQKNSFLPYGWWSVSHPTATDYSTAYFRRDYCSKECLLKGIEGFE